MKQQKKQTKKNKEITKIKNVWHDLHSDIDYLRYIITLNEPIEVKQDLLFALHNCLSKRAEAVAEIAFK